MDAQVMGFMCHEPDASRKLAIYRQIVFMHLHQVCLDSLAQSESWTHCQIPLVLPEHNFCAGKEDTPGKCIAMEGLSVLGHHLWTN